METIAIHGEDQQMTEHWKEVLAVDPYVVKSA